jgi:hypothetical protein
MADSEDDAPRFAADELRRIARYQRWVVATLLAQLALWVGYVLLSGGRDVRGGLGFPTILTFILGGVGGIYTFLLYWTVRGPFAAVVMGLGAVPPCMGVLVLLLAHGTATTALRTNGVPVGVFGADLDAIDDRHPYDDEDAGW